MFYLISHLQISWIFIYWAYTENDDAVNTHYTRSFFSWKKIWMNFKIFLKILSKSSSDLEVMAISVYLCRVKGQPL